MYAPFLSVAVDVKDGANGSDFGSHKDFERHQTPQTWLYLHDGEPVPDQNVTTLINGLKLRYLWRMKVKWVVLCSYIDHTFCHPKDALWDGINTGPPHDQAAISLQHTIELGQNLVNLIVCKVLHHAHIPDAIN
jgi:hypothetical protein